MARTHVISNKQASPTTLAKSTANGPKAIRNRNGFMRISIRPPKPSRTTTGPVCRGLPSEEMLNCAVLGDILKKDFVL
jgi:hypothetical protein